MESPKNRASQPKGRAAVLCGTVAATGVASSVVRASFPCTAQAESSSRTESSQASALYLIPDPSPGSAAGLPSPRRGLFAGKLPAPLPAEPKSRLLSAEKTGLRGPLFLKAP